MKKRMNESKELPPVEYLRECFDYDPETGILSWSKSRPSSHFRTTARWKQYMSQTAGKPAGCKHIKKNGSKWYMQVHVSNVVDRDSANSILMVHRICALLGGLPVTKDVLIDHKNGDIWDQRLSNLRVASYSDNARNCRAHSDKKGTLPRGVFKNHRGGGFSARISLGTFATPELAYEAVCKAARLYHGEFARVD